MQWVPAGHSFRAVFAIHNLSPASGCMLWYVARMRTLAEILGDAVKLVWYGPVGLVNLVNGKASGGVAVVTNVTNTVTNSLAQELRPQATPDRPAAAFDKLPPSIDNPVQLPWRRRRKRSAAVTNVTNTFANSLAQELGRQATPARPAAAFDKLPPSIDNPVQRPWRRRRKRSAAVTNTKKVPLTGAQRQDRYRKKDPDRFDRLREEAKEHMAALRKRRKSEKETAQAAKDNVVAFRRA
ncbi:MAG: hypothetical protein ABWY63_07025 [Hyphomicrobiaceae bacterium]